MENHNFQSFFYNFIKTRMTRYEYDQNLCFLLYFQNQTMEKCSCYNQQYINFNDYPQPCITRKDILCQDKVFFDLMKTDLTTVFTDECPLGI